ncbi:sensor histidine kinase [Frigoriglobus tundricola]|uniref:histidine kinase n=1 Tax=Frigoriglobus tundricola TaxID=2774151 RepID=A0A6M5YF88_9BACT|nr:HAMP domain-containing sensor histidine kinase [Frigoriglobus tundricola]QJW92659.1 hypothetical protein FTUN_0156 [Frigoriglobus tundricola]
MRSIRRSLLGYLFMLIMIALGAVGVLVDRFAVGAIRSRERSEAERIEREFELRQHDAKIKFDSDLLAETKALAKEVQYKTAALLGQNPEQRNRGAQRPPDLRATLMGLAPIPFVQPTLTTARVLLARSGPGPRPAEPPVKAPDDEGRNYACRIALLGFSAPPFALPALATVGALEPRTDWWRYNPYPGWMEYDAPRAFVRIQEAMKNTFGEDDHPGIFQITLVATYPGHSNHTVAVVRSNRIGSDLPLDPAWLETNPDAEPKFDDPPVPEPGHLRRVVTATHGGRPIVFGVWLAAPPPATLLPRGGPPRFPDLGVRVFVHHARPYSELEARLAAAREEGDRQLLSVREETQMELAQFRSRLVLIGSITFAALVLGGWFLVARGLSPLHKLSDAVSRVSEKDFRLPIGAAELGRELAPIHARLTQTLILLQRAFEREKQAVADISHELRTPIASLLATIDVALRKPRTPDQYRSTLEECRLISKQLGQLVERIMTLASLDAGNDHSHVARVNVADLVGGCAAVIRPLADANTITVSVRTDDDLALETDAAKLREVLMNLLHNAVEYNKPGGSIELVARADGTAAVFEVRDTGIGIPADLQEKIFERFYRADASRHATGVHAGLGLAIVKEYVSRLNGTIALESEPGAGTTFRVTLAAANDFPPGPPSTPTRTKSLRDDAVATGS